MSQQFESVLGRPYKPNASSKVLEATGGTNNRTFSSKKCTSLLRGLVIFFFVWVIALTWLHVMHAEISFEAHLLKQATSSEGKLQSLAHLGNKIAHINYEIPSSLDDDSVAIFEKDTGSDGDDDISLNTKTIMEDITTESNKRFAYNIHH